MANGQILWTREQILTREVHLSYLYLINPKEFLTKYNLKPKGICFAHSRWHPSVKGPASRLRQVPTVTKPKRKVWIE
jgi:hypothetical protein